MAEGTALVIGRAASRGGCKVSTTMSSDAETEAEATARAAEALIQSPH